MYWLWYTIPIRNQIRKKLWMFLFLKLGVVMKNLSISEICLNKTNPGRDQFGPSLWAWKLYENTAECFSSIKHFSSRVKAAEPARASVPWAAYVYLNRMGSLGWGFFPHLLEWPWNSEVKDSRKIWILSHVCNFWRSYVHLGMFWTVFAAPQSAKTTKEVWNRTCWILILSFEIFQKVFVPSKFL